MKRVWIALLAAAVPAVALAASGIGAGSLALVPALPASAEAAYAMFVDKDGQLKPGAQYTAIENKIQNTVTDGVPGANPAGMQSAKDLAAHYNTPQGQAEIANMSVAQKMALAQKMQAAMGQGAQPVASGPISPGDIALIKQVQIYPQTADVERKIVSIHQSAVALEAQWDKDAAALDAQANAAKSKLPVCPGEAGEPSEIALRDVDQTYADKKIALATSYLPKFNPLVAAFRQAIAPEIAHGDNAAAAWSRIANPAMKSQMAPAARGAAGNGVLDAGLLLGFEQDFALKAARAVADRKNVDHLYRNAKGC